MMSLEVRQDAKLGGIIGRLGNAPEKARNAVVGILRNQLVFADKVLAEEIRRTYTVDKVGLTSDSSKKRAIRHGGMSAELVITARQVALRHFEVSPKSDTRLAHRVSAYFNGGFHRVHPGKSITYRFRKSAGAKHAEDAFMIRGRNSGANVALRPTSSSGKGKDRVVKAMHGPSSAQMAGDREVLAKAVPRIDGRAAGAIAKALKEVHL